MHHALRDDDAVLVVEALPRHIGHREVSAQRQLGVVHRSGVGQGLPCYHALAHLDDGTMVDAGGLVGTLVLGQVVALKALVAGIDHDVSGVYLYYGAVVCRADQLAGVQSGAVLHAGTHQRGHRTDEGHCLTLHVGAHEGTLCIVMLQEGNEGGSYREHLARRHVHVVDVCHGSLSRGAKRAVIVAGTGYDTLGFYQLA